MVKLVRRNRVFVPPHWIGQHDRVSVNGVVYNVDRYHRSNYNYLTPAINPATQKSVNRHNRAVDLGGVIILPQKKRKIKDITTARARPSGSLSEFKIKHSKKKREDWIISMWREGHSGDVDFSIHAKKGKVSRTSYDESLWRMEKDKNKMDLFSKTGLDKPRDDVAYFTNSAGRKVYVGATNKSVRTNLGLNFRKAMFRNFTTEEVRAMNGVFVEGSAPISSGALSNTHYPKWGKNIIHAPVKYMDFESGLTHEMEHARKFGQEERIRDRSLVEKQVEYSTVGRVSPNAVKEVDIGYYQHIPHIEAYVKSTRSSRYSDKPSTFSMEKYKDLVREAKVKDRILLTGSMNRSLKGKRLQKRIKETFPDSEIYKAHFSPAELIDRYFRVKQANGEIAEIHMRFDKPRNMSGIRQDLKKKFGKDVEAWEWQDGKKVKIIG